MFGATLNSGNSGRSDQFYRTYGEERRLVVTNFSDKVRPFSVDVHVEQVMIENMPTDVTALADYSLAPWQAFVVKVSQ